MQNNSFAVFILTHGRPENIKTLSTIRSCGYTGDVYFIIDNEDKKSDQYIKKFGSQHVKIFDKKQWADKIDEGNNFDERRTITHARNACFQIAKDIGIKYFLQLDDDYYYFGYRYINGAKKIKNLDNVFDIILKFYQSVEIKSIAFGQGGDHIGGFGGIKLKRKCMNSFFCSTDRPFQFIGSMNEDVNTYTTLGSRGDLFFTFTNIQLDQKDTQSQSDGITDMYKKFGTYCKSFTTVIMQPSSVKVSLMNTTHQRLHHTINWANTVPKIIDEKFRK